MTIGALIGAACSILLNVAEIILDLGLLPLDVPISIRLRLPDKQVAIILVPICCYSVINKPNYF